MPWFHHDRDRDAYPPALAHFADRLSRLDDGDLLALCAAWRDTPQRHAAIEAVAAAVEATDRQAILDDLRVRLGGWAGRIGRLGGMVSMTGVASFGREEDLRRQALPPLYDAASALLVSDVLDAQSLEALTAPWTSTFGDEGEAER